MPWFPAGGATLQRRCDALVLPEGDTVTRRRRVSGPSSPRRASADRGSGHLRSDHVGPHLRRCSRLVRPVAVRLVEPVSGRLAILAGAVGFQEHQGRRRPSLLGLDCLKGPRQAAERSEAGRVRLRHGLSQQPLKGRRHVVTTRPWRGHLSDPPDECERRIVPVQVPRMASARREGATKWHRANRRRRIGLRATC